MKANGSIVSLLVTAALSLPCIVHAAGIQERVPGSTDEARLAAQRAPQQSAQSPYGYDELAAMSRPSSTDEARVLAARHQAARAPLAQGSDCFQAGAMSSGSTDEARASVGRRLIGSFEACSPHA
jgi:hypothetical protein